MKRFLLVTFVLVSILFMGFSQQNKDQPLPVRGLCIKVPESGDLDLFLKFIREDLTKYHVNLLVLRIDYNYLYKSHPELRGENTLSKKEVKKIVNECRKAKIEIVPQINLLGHQSWHEHTDPLLRVYPEFDETPGVKMPEKYKWPNEDKLYCKSYCPLHPGVHKVVFDLVDEIMDVFEAKAFHAGMDEVFYLGEDGCPRCAGKDKAELFAGEVWKIRNHLALTNKKLWIWGDRLIDGKTTGLGMWEASMNNTYRAIDMIPKDVVICDWHYERPDPTAPYFAIKGLDVISCPYRKPDVAIKQFHDMVEFRNISSHEMSKHFKGMLQTVWTDCGTFLKVWYGDKSMDEDLQMQAKCFRALLEEMNLSKSYSPL